MKKYLKYIIIALIVLVAISFIINGIVILKTKNKIDNIKDDNYDCILVLGAATWGDEPSPMLKDRLDRAIELYKSGVSKKIVMSGDNTKNDYDEVNIMKNYAIENGVLSEDIFMDHAGISTYDSMYRIQNIFNAKKIVVVTQKYHMYRALYIADKLGLDAVGASADPRKYTGQFMREAREILARNKDVFKSIFKPKSKFLGDSISLNDSGDVTNDK